MMLLRRCTMSSPTAHAHAHAHAHTRSHAMRRAALTESRVMVAMAVHMQAPRCSHRHAWGRQFWRSGDGVNGSSSDLTLASTRPSVGARAYVGSAMFSTTNTQEPHAAAAATDVPNKSTGELPAHLKVKMPSDLSGGSEFLLSALPLSPRRHHHTSFVDPAPPSTT